MMNNSRNRLKQWNAICMMTDRGEWVNILGVGGDMSASEGELL